MVNTDSKRAVLYIRLSKSDDASTGIERQRADLHALADREGWAIVAELVDDGVSGRKSRAKADDALRMLRDGDADVLAVWKLDRWSRQGFAALAALVECLDARPAALFVALKDGLRSDTTSWRLMAAVLAEVARAEVENTSDRVKSSQTYLLTVGRFRGYTVPFGYRAVDNPDGPGRVLVHDEVEAALVRELVSRLLDGASLTELTNDLNARAMPATKSPARKARQAGKPTAGLDTGRWHLTVLRSILRSDTLLGRTTHEVGGVRVPVTGPDGLPLTLWEPLVDHATLALLRERLPVEKGKLSGRPRAARVLSGVAFCAVCDSKLYVVRSGAHVYYRCAAKRPDLVPPCPAPQLHAVVLEDYVGGHVLHLTGEAPEFEEVRVVDNPEAASELADIDGALRDNAAALMVDGADLPGIFARIEALKARRRELNDRPASVHTLHVPTGRTRAEAWHAADPSTPEGIRKRRELILYVLDHVTLAPGATRASTVEERVAFRLNDATVSATA